MQNRKCKILEADTGKFMKTVVCYLAGVPSPHKNPHKVEILKKFASGIHLAGDKGIAHTGQNLIPCDVAVIQGWVHEDSPNTPHLILRRNVAANQQNKHTVIIDSNLFNYKNNDHPIKYSRYSLDGVFPTTGNYFWDNPDPLRWKQISRDLGIILKEWRTTGNHILICTQRNGGWSMKGLSVLNWLEQTVDKIKKYSDRPIIVRGHPGDKQALAYLKSKPGRYRISTNKNIIEDFHNAWAVVNYNSTPAVAASIEGIPAFVTDPTPQTSQAFDVANTDLQKIENPEFKDRQQWIEKISMCHWKHEEIVNGSAWLHIRKYI
jgi:hypothetical protein